MFSLSRAGVRRTRTQDVERRQGFTEPDHRSRRFSPPEGQESLQEEEATAERKEVSTVLPIPFKRSPKNRRFSGEKWCNKWRIVRKILASFLFFFYELNKSEIRITFFRSVSSNIPSFYCGLSAFFLVKRPCSLVKELFARLCTSRWFNLTHGYILPRCLGMSWAKLGEFNQAIEAWNTIGRNQGSVKIRKTLSLPG